MFMMKIWRVNSWIHNKVLEDVNAIKNTKYSSVYVVVYFFEQVFLEFIKDLSSAIKHPYGVIVYIVFGLLSMFVSLIISSRIINGAKTQIENNVDKYIDYKNASTDKIIDCATMLGYLSPLVCLITLVTGIGPANTYKWNIYGLVIFLGVLIPLIIKKNTPKEDKLSFEDVLQLDCAFSIAHINYGESPIFNGSDSKNLAEESRKNSLSSMEKIEDVIENIERFDGTENDYEQGDRLLLWKNYWLENINAFNKLMQLLPNSVVTVYIGRQAIETGIKYLLLKKTKQINRTHDLGELATLFFKEYEVDLDYMNCVDVFCEKFCKYIEGGNVEYFRYPEYKGNSFFAGNRLSIKWLLYNLNLIVLKLIHFADLDSEV